MKEHWGNHGYEALSAFEITIPRAYKAHLWPNLTIHLARFIKDHRSRDRAVVDAVWTKDPKALPQIIQRYLRYMALRRSGWGQFLYPDVMFVSDAQRLIPSTYHRWCEDNVGERFVAGPSSPNEQAHQTVQIENRMKFLWQAEFKEPYHALAASGGDDADLSDSEPTFTTSVACLRCEQNDGSMQQSSDTEGSLHGMPLQGLEFRLLKFLYRCGAGRLHYELTRHSRDNVPSYTATSYVCG